MLLILLFFFFFFFFLVLFLLLTCCSCFVVALLNHFFLVVCYVLCLLFGLLRRDPISQVFFPFSPRQLLVVLFSSSASSSSSSPLSPSLFDICTFLLPIAFYLSQSLLFFCISFFCFLLSGLLSQTNLVSNPSCSHFCISSYFCSCFASCFASFLLLLEKHLLTKK